MVMIPTTRLSSLVLSSSDPQMTNSKTVDTATDNQGIKHCLVHPPSIIVTKDMIPAIQEARS
jgi:hypothetical protein